MLWEDTGLPWVAPSPNMPTPDTARVYPGGCLIEGTNMSEGRGTTRPFEWVGAPWLDAHAYAEGLSAERLPGVVFRPARFRPTFQKWAGQVCGGVQLHVTDHARFKPFLTGLAVIAVARSGAVGVELLLAEFTFTVAFLALPVGIAWRGRQQGSLWYAVGGLFLLLVMARIFFF